MDGREGMTSFYLNRGVSGSGNQSGRLYFSPPGFKTESNPNISHGHHHMRVPSSVGSSFQVERSSSPSFAHGINMGGGGGGGGGGGVSNSITTPLSLSDSVVKKKRGRPRKYAPDESHMQLGLTPPSLSAPGSINPTRKKNRGRPPGTGWKQRLATVGEWMNNSAGMAFTPHIILASAGEDVAEKILSFAQQRPRALCILSGNGAVSAVTLRQLSSSVTFEGRFDILRLSGSYLPSENGGREGGLSISICSGEGNVIGGAIGGKLIASTLVQVVACSFVYDGNNVKMKAKADAPSTDDKSSVIQLNEPSPDPNPTRTQNSIAIGWQPDLRASLRNLRADIDLTRG